MASRKRYALTGEVTISVNTVVWATSEKAARAAARARNPSTSVSDSGDENEEWVCGNELDGTVKVIECEESDNGSEDDHDG